MQKSDVVDAVHKTDILDFLTDLLPIDENRQVGLQVFDSLTCQEGEVEEDDGKGEMPQMTAGYWKMPADDGGHPHGQR